MFKLSVCKADERKMKFARSGQETRYLYSLFFGIKKIKERSFQVFRNRSRIKKNTIKIPFQEEINIF